MMITMVITATTKSEFLRGLVTQLTIIQKYLFLSSCKTYKAQNVKVSKEVRNKVMKNMNTL